MSNPPLGPGEAVGGGGGDGNGQWAPRGGRGQGGGRGNPWDLRDAFRGFGPFNRDDTRVGEQDGANNVRRHRLFMWNNEEGDCVELPPGWTPRQMPPQQQPPQLYRWSDEAGSVVALRLGWTPPQTSQNLTRSQEQNEALPPQQQPPQLYRWSDEAGSVVALRLGWTPPQTSQNLTQSQERNEALPQQQQAFIPPVAHSAQGVSQQPTGPAKRHPSAYHGEKPEKRKRNNAGEDEQDAQPEKRRMGRPSKYEALITELEEDRQRRHEEWPRIFGTGGVQPNPWSPKNRPEDNPEDDAQDEEPPKENDG